MIDFEKKILNSDKFRQAALYFQKYGAYTLAPKGTREYFDYWDRETERCIVGYKSDDGDFISGYFYFYLNYCPIQRLVRKEVSDGKGGTKWVRRRESEFPDFYDYDYYFFQMVWEAEEEGKHMVVLKKRGAGYSFKCGSMLMRNFYLIPESKSYAIASEKEYLIKDGLLTKAWGFMRHIDENTAWAKKRQKKDTDLHKRASFESTDELGNKIEDGYMSEVIGVTLKNDPNRARGKRGKLILWEESGCHIKGTKVIMSDGRLKNVEDINVGEFLMGPDGTPRKVLERHVGTDHMYKIIPKNGHEQIVNSRHIIYGEKQNYYGEKPTKFELTPVEYLKEVTKYPKRKYHYSLLKADAIEFSKKDLLIDPYLLGLWLGDGDSSNTSIANEDKEVIDYLENYANTHGLFLRKHKVGDTNCFSMLLTPGRNKNGNWLRNEFKKLNLLNNKHIPEDYIYTSKEDRLKLLAGLIDTDGSYSSTKKCIEISQHASRKHIIDAAAFIARSLGMRATVSSRISKERIVKGKIIKGGGVQWRLSILNGHEQIPTLIKRKQSENRSCFLRNETSTRFDVEYYGIDKYYGFTVDKDHLFLIDDFTITHNSFSNILQAWQIARPSVEEDGVAYGLMIAFGTGGDESSAFDGLKEMFYNPSGYNILSTNNIWDEGADGSQCGFFVPVYANMSVTDENGIRLFMDNDGNTIRHKAFEYALSERQKVIDGASDTRAIDRYIAENPATPMEACLELTGNIFPKKELQQQLSKIRINKKLQAHKQVGDLMWDNGQITWHIKKKGDIVKYPLGKDSDHTGSIVIWEHPVKDAPHGLYIAGCLTPGEKVNTSIGLKNVEDITLDDKLINKDGDEVGINTLLRYDKINEPTFKIKLSNIYRTTNFTQEHPLYVSNIVYNTDKTIKEVGFNFNFVKAKDVKKNMWFKTPNIYRKNKQYSLPFSISDKDYFWWFVGLWLGDGWLSNDKVYVCFNKSEQVYIDRFTEFVNDVLDRKIYKRTRNNCIEMSFGHKGLSEFLLTTFGIKAKDKKIPEWVKYIPYEYKCNLMQGYLNSDGCITKNGKYYSTEFVSVGQELLEGFQDILFSMGIISNMTRLRDSKTAIIENRTVKQLPTYHLRMSHHDTLMFAKEMPFTDDIKIKRINFSELPLIRTRPKNGCFFSEDLAYIYIKIKDIEEGLYTGTVYNFDCETHTFVTQYCTGHNCDPYDHDQSGTNSLGSTFVYKRFQNFESYYDVIVAEYTGRPDTAEEYYENVRKLLIYYNAKLLYENERKGIFPYFTSKHCDYLLADQPDIISDIIGKSTVQRRKGIHMTKDIKEYGLGLIKEWLNSEFAPGEKNLTRILSEPLLEELISYNDKGNFDRVIAVIMVMIYKLQLYNITVKERKEESKNQTLFSSPLFGADWFDNNEDKSTKNLLGI